MLEALGAGYVLVLLFLVALAVLWFLLPFAVFGIKDKLTRIAKLLEHQNSLLALQIDSAIIEKKKRVDVDKLVVP